MPKEKGVSFKKIKSGNLKAIVSEYKKSHNKHIIMYIHGGGFVSGSASSSKGYCSMLAKYSGCKVIAVDYALAPECAFPDGFNDCFNAFCKIIHMYPDAKITLVGESAGTNLCLALALKVKDMQKIACVLVHNFTGSLDRTEHIVDDFTVKEGCLNPLNQIYVAENKADNPFISPLLGNFINFPPTFITCDYNKTLYADAKTLYQKCEQANVDVELIEMSIKSVIGGTSEELTTLEPDIKNVHKTNTSFWDTIGSDVLGVTALPSYGAFVSEESFICWKILQIKKFWKSVAETVIR